MNAALDRAELMEVAEGCLCFQARKAARALTRFYDRFLAGSGIEPTQFNVLVAIGIMEPVAMAPLAEQLGLERTTFTRNLGVLERDGLVSVKRGTDARVRLLSLTPRGRAALKTALPLWRKAQRAAENFLGEKEFNQLLKALSLPPGNLHRECKRIENYEN